MNDALFARLRWLQVGLRLNNRINDGSFGNGDRFRLWLASANQIHRHRLGRRRRHLQ